MGTPASARHGGVSAVSSTKPAKAGFGGFVHKTDQGGDAYGLRYRGGGFLLGLGLKTRAESTRLDGRHVAASGRSRRGEATDEEARWPSDSEDCRVGP